MMNLRRRLYAVLEEGGERADSGWFHNLFLIILITLNAVAVVLESVPSIASDYGAGFQSFEAASVAVSNVEYVLRLWIRVEIPNWSSHGPWYARCRHMVSFLGIIDLLAILQFFLSTIFGSISGYSAYCARFGS